MTKRKIQYIIALMAFGSLGLIIFQFYWLGFTLRAKNEQFGSDVRDAMQRVVRRLGQEEFFFLAKQKMDAQEKQKQLAAIAKPVNAKESAKGLASKTPTPTSNVPLSLEGVATITLPSDILVSKSTEILPNGEIREYEEFSVNMDLEEIQKRLNENKQLDAIFAEALRQREQAQYKQDSAIKAKKLADQKKKQKEHHTNDDTSIAQEKHDVNDQGQMAKEVFNDFLFKKRNIYERINYFVLDSLLRYEIKNKGINIPFEYGISTKEQPSLLHYASSLKYKANGLKSDKDTYLVNLFPNDFSNSESYLRVYFPNQDRYIMRNMWVMYTSSLLLILVVLGCFYIAVNTIVKQKHLADIKNDFINNMTHEFKTPISTISLATQMLQDKDVAASKTMFNRYLNIIKDENKRLGSQVEKVLQTAQMERGELKLKLGLVNVHQVIEHVLENISPQIELRDGEITLDLQAHNSEIEADEVHLTNIIFNLLDNANKYSLEKPIISIATAEVEGGISIKVSDKGIGMGKESIKNIFEKFYRVPTGNLHDVKGFGLGLSYVKKMVDEHHGKIKVQSKLGEGSQFEIILPSSAARSTH
ncbi:sensor histidine kinase [Flectobacillus major]|uniref:sensor histidine kinase n=1 Tax=Flectobacillus major TaxID=103 RepID=UPI0004194853|nr:HAMP domain-containing sensor histidine kinase [Flectobacillus major]